MSGVTKTRGMKLARLPKPWYLRGFLSWQCGALRVFGVVPNRQFFALKAVFAR